jgi:hypothetical protein
MSTRTNLRQKSPKEDREKWLNTPPNCTIVSIKPNKNGTLDYIKACVVEGESKIRLSRTMVDLKSGDFSTVPTDPEEVEIK